MLVRNSAAARQQLLRVAHTILKKEIKDVTKRGAEKKGDAVMTLTGEMLIKLTSLFPCSHISLLSRYFALSDMEVYFHMT